MGSKYKKLLDEAIEDLHEQLKKGKTENLVKYMEQIAKFHKYSWGNCILMMIQRPGVSIVAGYKQWQQMGYSVKKGAQSIKILAPRIIKGKEIDGEWVSIRQLPEGEDYEERLIGFREVSVFDISDTTADGKITFFKPLGSDKENMYQDLVKIFEGENIEIKEVEELAAEGCVDKVTKQISIKQNRDANNKLLTLLHELGHYYTHLSDEDKYTREERELHAEAVSFIVARYLGMDNPFSSDYILNWRNKVEDFKKQMDVINRSAIKIIKIVEARMKGEERCVA